MSPIPESQDVLQRDGVPDNIKSFYKVNHIWRFRYDRPFHKGTKDKENEFKVGDTQCLCTQKLSSVPFCFSLSLLPFCLARLVILSHLSGLVSVLL